MSDLVYAAYHNDPVKLTDLLALQQWRDVIDEFHRVGDWVSVFYLFIFSFRGIKCLHV